MSLTINPDLLAAVNACTFSHVEDRVRAPTDKINAITKLVNHGLQALVNVDMNFVYCGNLRINRNASLHERMFVVADKLGNTSQILSNIDKITSQGKSILYDVFNNLKTKYPSLRREDLTSATILYGIEPTHTFVSTGEVPISDTEYCVETFFKPLLKDESNLGLLLLLIDGDIITSPDERACLASPDILLLIKNSIQIFLDSIKEKAIEDARRDFRTYRSILYNEEIFNIAHDWLDDFNERNKELNAWSFAGYLLSASPSSAKADCSAAFRFLHLCQAQERGFPSCVLINLFNTLLEAYMKKIDEMIAKSLKETGHATGPAVPATPGAAASAAPAAAPAAPVTPSEVKSPKNS